MITGICLGPAPARVRPWPLHLAAHLASRNVAQRLPGLRRWGIRIGTPRRHLQQYPHLQPVDWRCAPLASAAAADGEASPLPYRSDKFLEVSVRSELDGDGGVYVYGKGTYNNRVTIQRLGSSWNGRLKAWVLKFPADEKGAAKAETFIAEIEVCTPPALPHRRACLSSAPALRACARSLLRLTSHHLAWPPSRPHPPHRRLPERTTESLPGRPMRGLTRPCSAPGLGRR